MVFSARNPGGRVTTRHVSVFTRKEFFFPLREVQCENFGKHRKVWKRVQRVSLCPVPDSVPPGAACTHLGGSWGVNAGPIPRAVVHPTQGTAGRPHPRRGVHLSVSTPLPAKLWASCIQISVSRFASRRIQLTQQLQNKTQNPVIASYPEVPDAEYSSSLPEAKLGFLLPQHKILFCTLTHTHAHTRTLLFGKTVCAEIMNHILLFLFPRGLAVPRRVVGRPW